MKSYTIEEYLDAGCNELKHMTMMAVHQMTGGKVCDTGCHAFSGGNCAAYKRLISVVKTSNGATETVREEAKRREISIKEVRRQRHVAITAS